MKIIEIHKKEQHEVNLHRADEQPTLHTVGKSKVHDVEKMISRPGDDTRTASLISGGVSSGVSARRALRDQKVSMAKDGLMEMVGSMPEGEDIKEVLEMADAAGSLPKNAAKTVIHKVEDTVIDGIVQNTTRDGAKIAAKKAAKRAQKVVKKVVKETAKQTAKNTAKETAKETAKATAQAVATTTAEIAAQTASTTAGSAGGPWGLLIGYAVGEVIEKKMDETDLKWQRRKRVIKSTKDNLQQEGEKKDDMLKTGLDLVKIEIRHMVSKVIKTVFKHVWLLILPFVLIVAFGLLMYSGIFA